MNLLEDPKYWQLNSSTSMTEVSGLDVDPRDPEETEMLKRHIEKLKEQVC
jgi:hypothetical protein